MQTDAVRPQGAGAGTAGEGRGVGSEQDLEGWRMWFRAMQEKRDRREGVGPHKAWSNRAG